MLKQFVIVVIHLCYFIGNGQINGDGCVHRDYGNGGTVCVCTEQYCDPIPAVVEPGPAQYTLYTSNLAGLRFNRTVGDLQADNGPYNATVDCNRIVLTPSEQYQQIHGFGGAFTDATGINIASLSPQLQSALLDAYFSRSDGIGYSLCRVPMGGTDFSTHSYSYLDTDEPDMELSAFALAQEDLQYKIPYIVGAQKRASATPTCHALRLFTSTWTAPKWMRTNDRNDYVGYLKTDMYQVWADYFVNFLRHYQQTANITFWGITTGNEPLLGILGSSINSVGWLGTQLNTWIEENLGPTIRQSEFSNIQIMAMDDQRILLPWYVDQALNNSAGSYIDGIAFHWYLNDLVPTTVLQSIHERYPDKFILSSEACNGFAPQAPHVLLGAWHRGEAYSKDIIDVLNNWATGWVDWNMVLDPVGGPTYISNFVDAPIIVNRTANEFLKQPMYYHLGHFAKFVPPGSVRIANDMHLVSTQNDEVYSIAFQRPNNGGVAVVIVNLSNEEIDDLKVVAPSYAKSFTIDITPRSITTALINW